MKISGFTMIKNATKLYYPVKQSILSVLPIVDEFIVALGNCDEDDHTREEIESIDSDKIKIINTIWDIEAYPDGMENAHQTDIAKGQCTGEWLFYLQADEVVHEKYLPIIKRRCAALIDHKEVEGLLFKYKHFWGDYNHYHISHRWYPYEIRIIRNNDDIHSWQSAQSFRRISDFDGKSYRQKQGTYKLKVARVDAAIYHYGWVRPPEYMQTKRRALDIIHKGLHKANQIYKNAQGAFDYGPLDLLQEFTGTHPKVMKDRIDEFYWQDRLQYTGRLNPNREKYKHEKIRYRLLTYIEQKLLGGRQIGGFKNYKIVKR